MSKLVEFFDCGNYMWIVEWDFVFGLLVVDIGWLGMQYQIFDLVSCWLISCCFRFQIDVLWCFVIGNNLFGECFEFFYG